MKIYVLDTSVVMAALLNESKVAREIIKKKVAFYAPPLLMYEVANVLKHKLPANFEAETLYQDFADFPIKYSELSQEQMGAVLMLAYETNTTIYDTCFHYLAKALGGVLLTSDREYYLKAEKLGSIELIK